MIITDLGDPRELQGYVRGAFDEVNRNQFMLSQFLGNENIDGIEWRAVRGTLQDQDSAQARAWDTESPIGKRQGVSRIMGELAPVSMKIPLGEELRLRKRALETGSQTEIINKIFDDAANLARSVAVRFELLRGEALYTGAVNLNENGVVQSVSFGRTATHDPAALAGAAKWDAPSTATPVTDIQGWMETYKDTNGIYPALILTSHKVNNLLSLNAQIRTLAATLAGTPAMVTPQVVASVLNAYNIPPIVEYDVKVRVNGSQVRVIPDNRVIFIPPAGEPLGKTYFGTTAEALELVEARAISQDEAPGMVAVVDKTFDPVATWTKCTAIGFPALINPDLTFVATVF